MWGKGNCIGISEYYVLAENYLDLNIFDNFLGNFITGDVSD